MVEQLLKEIENCCSNGIKLKVIEMKYFYKIMYCSFDMAMVCVDTSCVAPKTAYNLAERYIKIIESYLLVPQTHLKSGKKSLTYHWAFLNLGRKP